MTPEWFDIMRTTPLLILDWLKGLIVGAIKTVAQAAEAIIKPIAKYLVSSIGQALEPILNWYVELAMATPAPDVGGNLFSLPANDPWRAIFQKFWPWSVTLGLVILVVSYLVSESLSETPLTSPEKGRQREFGLIFGFIAIPMSRYALTLFLNVMQQLSETTRAAPWVGDHMLNISELATVDLGSALVAGAAAVSFGWVVYAIAILIQAVRITGIIMLTALTPVLLGFWLGRCPGLEKISGGLLKSLPVLSFAGPLTALCFSVMSLFISSDSNLQLQTVPDGATAFVEPVFMLAPGILGLLLPIGMVKSTKGFAAPGVLATSYGTGNAVTEKASEKGKDVASKAAKKGKEKAYEKAPDAATDAWEQRKKTEVDPTDGDLVGHEGEEVDLEGTVLDTETRTVTTENGEEKEVTRATVGEEDSRPEDGTEVEFRGEKGPSIEEGDEVRVEDAQVYTSQRPDGREEHRASVDLEDDGSVIKKGRDSLETYRKRDAKEDSDHREFGDDDGSSEDGGGDGESSSTEIDPGEDFDGSEYDDVTVEGEYIYQGTESPKTEPGKLDHGEIVPEGGEEGDGIRVENWRGKSGEALTEDGQVRIENADPGTYHSESRRSHPHEESGEYSKIATNENTSITEVDLGDGGSHSDRSEQAADVDPGDEFDPAEVDRVNTEGEWHDNGVHDNDDGFEQHGEVVPEGGSPGDGIEVKRPLGEEYGNDHVDDGQTVALDNAEVQTGTDGETPTLRDDAETTLTKDVDLGGSSDSTGQASSGGEQSSSSGSPNRDSPRSGGESGESGSSGTPDRSDSGGDSDYDPIESGADGNPFGPNKPAGDGGFSKWADPDNLQSHDD